MFTHLHNCSMNAWCCITWWSWQRSAMKTRFSYLYKAQLVNELILQENTFHFSFSKILFHFLCDFFTSEDCLLPIEGQLWHTHTFTLYLITLSIHHYIFSTHLHYPPTQPPPIQHNTAQAWQYSASVLLSAWPNISIYCEDFNKIWSPHHLTQAA